MLKFVGMGGGGGQTWFRSIYMNIIRFVAEIQIYNIIYEDFGTTYEQFQSLMPQMFLTLALLHRWTFKKKKLCRLQNELFHYFLGENLKGGLF